VWYDIRYDVAACRIGWSFSNPIAEAARSFETFSGPMVMLCLTKLMISPLAFSARCA